MYKNVKKKTKEILIEKIVKNNSFLVARVLFLSFTPLYLQIYK